MRREGRLTSKQEMYLKTVLLVRNKHKIARVRDVAKRLAVTPGTVSLALRKLQRAGFVEHEKYGGVVLTSNGIAVAKCTLRRYDTIRDVLIEVFGVNPDRAAKDACSMEHVISPTTVNRMMATLHRLRRGEFRPAEAPLTPDACANKEPSMQRVPGLILASDLH